MAAESKLEKKVVKWANAHGVYTRKFSSPAHRGVPDRIFINRRRVAFIEFKAPGEHPSALQMREIKELKERGMLVIWTHSFEEAKNWLERSICAS